MNIKKALEQLEKFEKSKLYKHEEKINQIDINLYNKLCATHLDAGNSSRF